MTSVWARLEPLLARVDRPARYIGCEDGAPSPRPERFGPRGAVAWLLAYPDTYEIGLPNQGLQILGEILGERAGAVAERTYAPWRDLAALMRRDRVPLFSVDSHRPAAEFDVIAFNLSAELTYTNLLEMLDLAGIPIHTAARSGSDPVVIVGGHCAFNPEPLADFIDVAVLGDGEEVVGEITEVIAAWKSTGRSDRVALHRELAGIHGVYVPSLYEVRYEGDSIVAIEPRFAGVPNVVDKRVVADLADWPYPRRPISPLTEVVHDRLNVEVFRGCTRGCRFCQAGMVTRPVRERPADQVRRMVRHGLARTGQDELALTSLSTADFSDIGDVVGGVLADAAELPGSCGSTTINLPSLRVDAFTVGLAGQVMNGRRSGLTFAPDAGTWRMRMVINKLVTEADLYAAVDAAFEQGWTRIKLYFLTGLPTETDDDTLGIAELVRACAAIGRRHTSRASITASLGGFVPKAHTPFQWFGQNTEAELQRKIGLVRDATRTVRGARLKWHDPAATIAEGITSRGDRRLGRVIERVWRAGGTFQEWGECFDLERWRDALSAEGLSLDWYVHRHRSRNEILPWNHLSAGLHPEFLWDDWQSALAESGVEDCRWTPCYDCGVCTGYGVEHVVASPVPPAGGSQGTGQDLATGASVPVHLVGTASASAGSSAGSSAGCGGAAG